MANNYYTFTPVFVPGTKVRSDAVNTQYQALVTAFDLLPTSNMALTTGKATFATETGTGNAYVVAMPNTRTSNANGDEVIFYASHANTGVATLNVDGIGAISLVDRTGAALTSGAVVSGRLYVATYDSTNTRFVLDAAINTVTNIIDVTQGSSTDNPAAPGTFNANLAFQNASAAALANIGFNSDIDVTVKNVVVGGSIFWQTPSGVYGVRSAGNTDAEVRKLEFQHLDGTLRGAVGHVSGSTIELRNEINSGLVLLRGHDVGGTLTTVYSGNPDGPSTMYYDGSLSAQTKTGATGGFEINNSQTGAGFERVLTQSDSARTSTTAALAAIGNVINTAAEKEAGFMVFNTTTNIPVWASGNTDGAVWVLATGVTAHTPV